MIEIDGKQVFTELSELVDPTHTALVVVDMQGLLRARRGVRPARGGHLDAPADDPAPGPARGGRPETAVPVVFIQMTVLPNRFTITATA